MKILVPIDFSENSKKALDFAVSLAKKKNGSITILHVIEAIYDFAAQAAIVIEGMHRDAESYLEELVTFYKKKDVQIKGLIKDGTVSIMTSKTAEEINADLIVIGTQGKTGIKRTLLGSTSIDVIKASECPVLLIPADAKVENIDKVTLALEFSDHEEQFLEKVIQMSKNWELKLDFLHIEIHHNFKEELTLLGLETYVNNKYPELESKLETLKSENLIEGLDKYLGKHKNVILVMCHNQKNIWDQILSKSKTIQMAYHTHVPLLIMN
ncbi:universal stress protein [Algoriphagus sp. SE2]|uniref:universal stress protein n=1 Tax=Algoriphagus sp. SE2 TaxID=3141536 RepID=UPI0031CCDCDF